MKDADFPKNGSARHPAWMESLYERLAEDDEGRVCRGIREDACRETPGNFFKTLTANTLTSIGDKLAGAKTTLPWLLGAAGAPAWCISLLVPLRESGSMLPQMLIGAWVRRQPVRKSIWALGSTVQGLAVLGMAWAAVALQGGVAGGVVLLLLGLFSLARGACSVAYKDVLGKTIPKTRRGRLSGWITALAGCGAMGAGMALGRLSGDQPAWVYAGLLSVAAVLWFAAAISYQRIVEYPGETDGGANGFATALDRLSLLRDDGVFRRFVIARALAMGSGLAAPFYIVLARGALGDALVWLGYFIAAEGLAGLLSAPVWGRWADRSSRLVFATASALAAVCTLAVAGATWLGLSEAAARWFFPLAFLGLGIAHAGVRLGRKTYLVDVADGNQRTDYVAVSNSLIGVILLVVGLLSAAAAWFSIQTALIGLGTAGLLGAWLSLGWRKTALN